ncbi:hypothetical protein BKA82DRAFT_4353662 [Pisolithus tinctorius]|nr:hypothetical protein BKA82DRAFT_4353662 [Pisolithus tinctorius]
MPSRLEGPKFSFFFGVLYLRLRCFREYKPSQSIDESSSGDAPVVRRFASRPVAMLLRTVDTYLVNDWSGFKGRWTIKRLAKGDTISMLDVVQRHCGVLFGLGGVWHKSGTTCIVHIAALQRGVRDPSVYYKVNIEDTWAIINTAIAAGSCRLVYTSSAGDVFGATDVANIDGRVPFLKKPFDVYNLLPYHSTTSSEPRLDPEGATAKLNESLHCALPPICATTKYHHTTQTLSSYVAPTPNAESILSAFNTPFDPCGLMDPVVCSQSDGQAFFITNGEVFGILDFTRVYNKYERKPSHLKVQGTYEWLCDETRVWLVIEWWSFEATASFRWRRCIEDSCAELNGSIFLFCFVSYRLQLLYYRKVQCLQRGRSNIQVAAVWKCKATHKDEHRTIKSKLHKTIRQPYYEWGERVQYTRERMLTLQRSIEGKEMFDDEGREAAWWILATMTGLDVD